jgi:tetratricopeptide (TPR) repeat protein
MHLLGNMIFLWVVGCILEVGCGRIFYTALYLLTGLCAVGLFTLVYGNNTVPLIGASGAISGLMGAYTTTYGLKKIRVFYSLGFYFNYAKISALFLLPFWIGYEFYNLYLGGESNIAYVVHIGGLVSGGLIGFVNTQLLKRVDTQVFDEDPKDKISTLLETAMQRMSELDMKGARQPLNEILRTDPDNHIALTHLFNIDKLQPETDLFQHTASRLLAFLSKNSGEQKQTFDIYKEYRRVSKKIGLDADLLFHLGSVFSSTGNLDDAEELVELALQKAAQHPRAPAILFNLANANVKRGRTERSQQFLDIIYRRYPNSKEFKVAARIMKKPIT